MMLPNAIMDRRTALRGIGSAVALPLLEAMLPRLAVAGTGTNAKKTMPVRFACVYVPNGKNMAEWTPKNEGPLTQLPYILNPLKSVKDDVLVLSGLTCDKARAHGDGPGDHARAMSAFLTGCQPRKTHGADIKAGISIDQFLAQGIGELTRFPSLEIGCEPSRSAGNCDSGYSCVYNSTVAWRTETTPVPKEVNPRLVFERLFGAGKGDEVAESRSRRERYRKSVLDLVRDDARQLQRGLGASDSRKLDEYLTAVREVEQRITKASAEANVQKPLPQGTKVPPQVVPRDYAEHLRLMNDLLVLAFQTDSTRVVTHVYANESSGRGYPFLGVPEGHHDLSHHQRDAKKLEKIKTINHFHVSMFAELLQKLKATKEGDQTLLDRCMIVYGSGNGDGNRHNHDDLPILLAGRGGGSFATGRHIRFPAETPLTNLFLNIVDAFDLNAKSFGDSTGRLNGLSA
ncbi:MAG: DUF1552 domain-containing protein [Gemmataceae bacterium]